MNLLANFIDNLTHGAAIGGGFAINRVVGMTTLLAIIIHEIPHEMGDFAILLRSGFDRHQATKAQLVTSLGGILGASIALFYSNSIESIYLSISSVLFEYFHFIQIHYGFYLLQVEDFFMLLWLKQFPIFSKKIISSKIFSFFFFIQIFLFFFNLNQRNSFRQFIGIIAGLAIIYSVVRYIG